MATEAGAFKLHLGIDVGSTTVKVAVLDEDEPLNDLGVGLIDIHSTPRATITDALANIEFAVIVNRHNNGDIEFHASVVVVDTMARSAMYNARTIFERYETSS